MHMHLDAGGVDATKLMIDRSGQADGSFPAGTVYLLEGEGPRSIRKETMPTLRTCSGHLICKLITGRQQVAIGSASDWFDHGFSEV